MTQPARTNLRDHVTRRAERLGAQARAAMARWQAWLGAATRPIFRPRSLTWQLALLSVGIATFAILATAVISAIAVGNSFNSYLQTELRRSVQIEANRISALTIQYNGNFLDAVQQELLSKIVNEPSSSIAGQIWVMDQQGNVLFPTRDSNVWRSDDPTTVTPAMRAAMTSGAITQGTLPGTQELLESGSARAYAAAPIIVSINGQPATIGAVAISSEPLSVGGGPAFIHSVDKWLIIGGILIALLVALVAIFLAQRVTKPIATLSRAATAMTTGDLDARVQLNPETTPEEIDALGATFNEMAAALQRDIEKLRMQDEQQRILLQNVSHDLATPLTSIGGFAEALEDDDLPPQMRLQFLHTIQQQTLRLSKMVDQLRQVVRLGAGKERMELQPLELRAFVEDTIDALRIESERKGIALINAIPADLPPVQADADRLTQAVMNLLDNALHYTPAGGQVRASAEATPDLVWVTIADTGPGIPPDDLPHLFDRFYRGDSSRNAHSGGSGLGLAIVRGIVEAHGGIIHVENAPEGGARFSFCLRRVETTLPTPSGELATTRGAGGMRV